MIDILLLLASFVLPAAPRVKPAELFCPECEAQPWLPTEHTTSGVRAVVTIYGQQSKSEKQGRCQYSFLQADVGWLGADLKRFTAVGGGNIVRGKQAAFTAACCTKHSVGNNPNAHVPEFSICSF